MDSAWVDLSIKDFVLILYQESEFSNKVIVAAGEDDKIAAVLRSYRRQAE